MKTKILFFLIMVTVFYSASLAGSETMERNEKVKNVLNEYLETGSPGMQYVVVNKDSIVFEYSAGLSDLIKNEPMNLFQTMAAFSMTKTITAITVLQLVEQNKLNIDDKVSKYVEHPYNPKITIRQLVNHTSGIPNPIPLKWVHLVEKHESYSEQEAIAKVLEKNPKLASEPGAKYKYSNIGYWLLGSVIEKASGENYTDYVTKNVFMLLGLSPAEIGFSINNMDNHAKGYIKKWSFMNFLGRFLMDKSVLGNDEGSWRHINNVYLNGPSYGGAIGSARAFSRILQDLLSENSKLLSSSTKQMLYIRQSTESGKKVDMTLGWHIGQLNNLTYYYKEGGGPGFRCEMRIYPESDIASVLMLNRTSFNFKKNMSKLDKNFVENRRL